MDITFRFPHLFSPTSNEVEDAAVLCELVEALARIDQIYLKTRASLLPPVPGIYKSGIVYGRTQEWLTIPACIANGYADCKSVSAWRIAELRMRGVECRPVHRWVQRPDGGKDFHILVMMPDGTWEDPSKILGMGSQENARFGTGGPKPPPRGSLPMPAASGYDWNRHFRQLSERWRRAG